MPPTVVLKEFCSGKSNLYMASPEFQMLQTSLGLVVFFLNLQAS